jgi:hypothetical protein
MDDIAAPRATRAIVGDDHAAAVPAQLRSSNNAAVIAVSSRARTVDPVGDPDLSLVLLCHEIIPI